MPSKLLTQTIPCKGGLNLAATDEELLLVPNEAIQLLNMEASKNGGYRRISGFETWGDTPILGTDQIKGILTYRGGVLVAKGTGLWHSFDGTTWTQVNTDAAPDSDRTTVTNANSVDLSTTNEKTLQMYVFERDDEEHVYIATGNSDPLYLLITGTTDVNARYTYRKVSVDIPEDNVLTAAKWLTVFQNQVIVANTLKDPSSLYYSSFASTDVMAGDPRTPQEIYTGSTSGQLGFHHPITGITEHRDILYVFTANSISRVAGLREGNPVVKPVTNNIGCVDGNTIQEIGGDLVFLAPDGLRTIAQTERISDVELGVISRKISPITKHIIERLDNMRFSSCVVREKNQYRLWYRDITVTNDGSQKGFIAAYAFDSATGGFRWEYSELHGWSPTAVYAGSDLNGLEFYVHGDSDGSVFQFEKGSSFGVDKIPWLYQTTYTHLGDIGIRKNIHDVFVKMKTEGVVNASLEIKYDYLSPDSPQPNAYPLGELDTVYLYGSSVYGLPSVYGTNTKENQKIYSEGSGFTVSLRIKDTGQADDPFTFESLQLNFTPSGRI